MLADSSSYFHQNGLGSFLQEGKLRHGGPFVELAVEFQVQKATSPLPCSFLLPPGATLLWRHE